MPYCDSVCILNLLGVDSLIRCDIARLFSVVTITDIQSDICVYKIILFFLWLPLSELPFLTET